MAADTITPLIVVVADFMSKHLLGLLSSASNAIIIYADLMAKNVLL